MLEFNDPKTKVIKYLFNDIGLNIRPGNPIYNDKENIIKIFLNAYIPNTIIDTKKNETKKVIYFFPEIDYVELDKDGEEFLRKPTAEEIDNKLEIKVSDLSKEINELIIEKYSLKWINFSLINSFFAPFIQILNEILNFDYIDYDIKLEKYLKCLINAKVIIYDPQNNRRLIFSNAFNEMRSISNNKEIISLAIAKIIEKQKNYLNKDLKIYSYIPYLEIPRLFYLDILIYAKSLVYDLNTFVNKYNLYKYTYYDKIRSLRIKSIIAEIINADILKFDKKNKQIYGNSEIVDRLLSKREEILSKKEGIKILEV
ncbi:MAG: hypothetical protein ACTSVV_16885 [Promethearchaeota archaeon]